MYMYVFICIDLYSVLMKRLYRLVLHVLDCISMYCMYYMYCMYCMYSFVLVCIVCIACILCIECIALYWYVLICISMYIACIVCISCICLYWYVLLVLGLQYKLEISIQTIQTWRSCDVIQRGRVFKLARAGAMPLRLTAVTRARAAGDVTVMGTGNIGRPWQFHHQCAAAPTVTLAGAARRWKKPPPPAESRRAGRGPWVSASVMVVPARVPAAVWVGTSRLGEIPADNLSYGVKATVVTVLCASMVGRRRWGAIMVQLL
jgi:hypothetical protein